MRETRVQQGTARRTIIGMRTLVLAFGAALAVACGSDSGPTDPGGNPTTNNPTAVGSYSISTVNGKALPVSVFAEGPYTYEVTSGTIGLTNDGKYTLVTNFKQTIPGNVSLYTDSTFGTWSQSGAQISFTDGQDGSKGTGTWVGTQLTIAVVDANVTTTFVYTKK